MVIDKVGPIKNGFYALGHASVPVYLMDGKFPALFDAGFVGLSHLYIQAIKEVLGERTPVYLFLTHAHWDHIGSAGIFKRTWPDMKIVASRITREILARPGVIDRVISLNQQALDALREWGVTPFYEGPFIPFEIDEILGSSKSYPVASDATVEWFASPGHTRDFTVYWIPEKGILIASEAAGCDNVPEFLVDYDVYEGGIKKFIDLDPRVLCTGHLLVLTGSDVREYLTRSWETAEEYRRFVEERLERGESVDEIIEQIKGIDWDEKPFPKQPLEAYLLNTRQRVLTLKERWEKGLSNRKS